MNKYIRGFMPCERQDEMQIENKLEIKSKIKPENKIKNQIEPSPKPPKQEKPRADINPSAAPTDNSQAQYTDCPLDPDVFNKSLAESLAENIGKSIADTEPREHEYPEYPVHKDIKPNVSYTGSGSLIISVFMAGRAIPLENARVVVTSEDGAPTVREVRYTDRSGRTEPIPLPTPSKRVSDAPQDDRPPYSVYNVTAELDGYHIDRGLGMVPIFDGVRSIQNYEMVPNEEHGI